MCGPRNTHNLPSISEMKELSTFDSTNFYLLLRVFSPSQVVGSRWWDKQRGFVSFLHLHKASSLYYTWRRRQPIWHSANIVCMHLDSPTKTLVVSLKNFKNAYLINSYSFIRLFTNGSFVVGGEGRWVDFRV